jgi:hypothetical protein
MSAIESLRESLAQGEVHDVQVGGALVELADRLNEIEARQKKGNSLLGMLCGRIPRPAPAKKGATKK